MSPTTELNERASRRVWLARAAALLLVVALLVTAGGRLAALVPAFAAWVEGLGAWGGAAFVVGYALACVAFVPASLLTLAAGAVFGLAKGVALVLAGATLGATAAFLLARYVLRGAVERRLRQDPRLAAIDGAVAGDGRRIVLLLRLSPAVPFSALNYALGVTRVRLADYLVAMVGIVPGTTLYVYYGRVAGTVAAAAGGAEVARGPADLALLGLGLLATIAVTVLVTRAARRALAGSAAAPVGGVGG